MTSAPSQIERSHLSTCGIWIRPIQWKQTLCICWWSCTHTCFTIWAHVSNKSSYLVHDIPWSTCSLKFSLIHIKVITLLMNTFASVVIIFTFFWGKTYTIHTVYYTIFDKKKIQTIKNALQYQTALISLNTSWFCRLVLFWCWSNQPGQHTAMLLASKS